MGHLAGGRRRREPQTTTRPMPALIRPAHTSGTVPGLVPLPSLRRMWIMPGKKYPAEQRERALRMAMDRLGGEPTPYACAKALGPKLGGGIEKLAKWVPPAPGGQGDPPGPPTGGAEGDKRGQ